MTNNKSDRETIYLQSAKIVGVKGIGNTLDLNFTPSKSREFMDNVEFWGLERSKYDFGALKTIMLIGENGTGKSSVLESLYLFEVFMKDSRRIFENKRHNPFGYFEGKGHAKWEMEYVTSSNGRVFKYFIEVEIIDNIISTEKLSFISTIDGKTTSMKECIYEVNNNNLITLFDCKLLSPERLLGSNGWSFIQRRWSAFSNLFSSEEEYNNHFIMHRHFFTNAFQPDINRHYGLEKHLKPVIYNNIHDGKLKEIIENLYKLFDKNIMNIQIINNEILIEYKLGNVNRMLRLDEYIAVASTGNIRSLDLIDSILRAITSQASIYIDEPERSIHETLSRFIVDQINEYAKGQVFYATHFLGLTELAIRTDQITLLFKGDDDKIKTRNGYEISPSKNSKFIASYMKTKNLSEPNGHAREFIDELMDAYGR